MECVHNRSHPLFRQVTDIPRLVLPNVYVCVVTGTRSPCFVWTHDV